MDAEPERLQKREKDKVAYKDIRKEDQKAKRHLNIEIASEIIDLIMDVAEEAQEFLETNKNNEDEDEAHLITKPQWR